MKQIVQNIKSGDLTLDEVPPPALLPMGVRVRTAMSLISAGTEKMLIELAQKSLVGKAQARPDLVKQVIDKAKKEGILNTFRNVMSKLDKPMPLGYSAAGIIEAVGAASGSWSVGDRVAIAGAGYANHAEVNYVPKNLVARIPENVSFEEAAYTTVASIALQGVRNCKPQIGEYVAVVGLGLIGLITAQILRANGCRVIGIDLDPKKIELGLKMGMDAGAVKDPAQDVERFTSGRGVDHCIITASTKSNQPIELAGEITRKQGAVTVVGAVGMQIPRDVYYKKELEISVSMSYGPGRYDMAYEEGGVDYPYDFVRWTEQRNMEAVLDLMDRKLLDVKPLTTHLFSLEDALAAYDMIKAGKEPFVGILLSYEVEKQQKAAIEVPDRKALPLNGKLRMGFAGAGNYASLHLLPHLRKNPDVRLTTLVTATGMNAMQKAKKFKFASGTTEFEEVLKDPDTNAVGIATRHGSHAEFTVRALQAGKHVFVEKPLVVTSAQLDQVVNAYHTANEKGRCAVMVGTNRRFSPMAKELKAFFVNTSSKQMIYRVNSGHIPSSSWLHVPEEGGGMLVGEMCHFVDMMIFLTGEMPTTVYAQKMTVHNDTVADADNISIVIGFNKGSLGTLCYNTVGDKSISKERFEVYGDGRVGVLDDFRQLELHYKGDTTKKKSMNQDKGQIAQIEETVRGFRQGISPIPFEEIVMGMRVIFAAQTALQTGNAVSLGVQEIEEIRADAP